MDEITETQMLIWGADVRMLKVGAACCEAHAVLQQLISCPVRPACD